MGRCFIITLGFHSDVGLRRIAEKGVKPGDKVLIVSGPPVQASKQAIEEFVLYASKVNVDQKNIREIHVDPLKASEGIEEIARTIEDFCGEEGIILELGGGLRAVSALVLLTLFGLRRKFAIESSVEGTGMSYSVPEGFVDFLINRVGTRDGDVIEKLRESDDSDARELAKSIGCGEKTVVNRMSALKKIGLIEKQGRGSPKLTVWGEAAASINSLFKKRKDSSLSKEDRPSR
jgi:CRISPR locus-related DNA-binding protein